MIRAKIDVAFIVYSQVNLVPTTVLSDFVSSLGLGRSSDSEKYQEILETIQDFIRKQQSLSLLNKDKRD